MRLIHRNAIYQPQISTLEPREQEFINIYQSKQRHFCSLIVSPIHKLFISQCPPQDSVQADRSYLRESKLKQLLELKISIKDRDIIY